MNILITELPSELVIFLKWYKIILYVLMAI